MNWIDVNDKLPELDGINRYDARIGHINLVIDELITDYSTEPVKVGNKYINGEDIYMFTMTQLNTMLRSVEDAFSYMEYVLLMDISQVILLRVDDGYAYNVDSGKGELSSRTVFYCAKFVEVYYGESLGNL